MGKIVKGMYIPDYVRLDELKDLLAEDVERKVYLSFKNEGYDDCDEISCFEIFIRVLKLEFKMDIQKAYRLAHVMEDIYNIG